MIVIPGGSGMEILLNVAMEVTLSLVLQGMVAELD